MVKKSLAVGTTDFSLWRMKQGFSRLVEWGVEYKITSHPIAPSVAAEAPLGIAPSSSRPAQKF
jgi:lipid II:glycine glycyltransferase (peptidoglycan interpeptide bridge formation enzyme)